VPEVIDHGLSGLVVNDEAEAVAAVRRTSMLDRLKVRRQFEHRFSVARMTADYLEQYAQAADGRASSVKLA
jgi:hypothetical protein